MGVITTPILIDAGPLIALFDKTDAYHDAILRFLQGKRYSFVSTIAVLTEVSHMLDFDVRAQVGFFNWVTEKGVRLVDITREDIFRVVQLTQKYADLPMDFADATLVVAAEKEGLASIISIDRDFDVYRLPGKQRIANVFSGYLPRPKGKPAR
jgi:predicted nucleic acid-binding protein